MAAEWIDYLLLLAMLYCSYTDIKEKKVKNAVTFPLMIFGLIYNTYIHGYKGFLFSVYGLAAGSLLAMTGGFGMGDVKLLMGIGSVKGAVFLIDLIAFSLLVSIMIAFFTNPRRFCRAMSNIFYTLKNLFLYGVFLKVGSEDNFAVPFAVCIFLGLIVTYLVGGDMIWGLLKNQ